jgi:AcrR family transcriptional regulator
MPRKTPTRQLILEATVDCIEKQGLEAVTTRSIAVQAGTNLASINYHFRSKEHLLQEVLAMTIKHMLQDVFEAIDDASQPFETVFSNVLFYLLDGAVRFPGITTAHLRQALDDERSISSRGMRRVFDGLTQRAVQAYPHTDADLLRLRMAQLMSSILFMMLQPGLFTVKRAQRLTNSEHARQLADSYAQLFYAGIK